ncbi:HlyD family efflux transporter periplasmic adaptor subunit [Lutibacter sp.]|uniref:efflux RND transporter periplasmic adaptor subunit n=1 Tax=Lutibacter sp. TaxID=1925666 RepID=UPI0025B9B6E7|nr:HlyD family efflux transporter periplasmic adaptor subunit [Lutibacter sp.]MCF6181717.1 HlyD family efflux transporter periplasmic adaptor subunit [Lutibacter sp.]
MKDSTKTIFLLISLILISSCGKITTETKPIRKNVTETIFASGILVPEDQYNLTSLSDGYIKKLDIEEGDIVTKNQLLAIVDNEQNIISAKSSVDLLTIAKANTNPNAPALKQAEINVELAKQKLLQDQKQAERYKKLYKLNSVSKLEYENVLLNLDNSKTNFLSLQENYKLLKQQADQQLIIQKSQKEVDNVSENYNKIKAIVGGKVYELKKELGDYIRKGDVIAVIGNPEKLYALLSIDESNISKVKLHQQVIIQLNTQVKKNYKGKVTEIYPAFDKQTQSFYCKIEFEDILDFKISGTQLQGNIIIENKNNALVIPRNYLSYSNKVKLKGGDEIAVEIGFISNDWVEIIHGLDENTVIIADKTK